MASIDSSKIIPNTRCHWNLKSSFEIEVKPLVYCPPLNHVTKYLTGFLPMIRGCTALAPIKTVNSSTQGLDSVCKWGETHLLNLQQVYNHLQHLLVDMDFSIVLSHNKLLCLPKRQKWSETEAHHLLFTLQIPSVARVQLGSGSKPRVRKGMYVFQVGGRNSVTWAITASWGLHEQEGGARSQCQQPNPRHLGVGCGHLNLYTVCPCSKLIL